MKFTGNLGKFGSNFSVYTGIIIRTAFKYQGRKRSYYTAFAEEIYCVLGLLKNSVK